MDLKFQEKKTVCKSVTWFISYAKSRIQENSCIFLKRPVHSFTYSQGIYIGMTGFYEISLQIRYIEMQESINISNSTVQWNNFSKDTSVAESHGFNIMFQIFSSTLDYREYSREFPIHFIFFIRAKMGDNYDICKNGSL